MRGKKDTQPSEMILNALNDWKERLERSENALEQERKSSSGLAQDLAVAENELHNLREKLKEQKEEMLKLNERLTAEFRNLAQDILDEKSRKFAVQNKEQISEILMPLGEKLRSFEKKVEDTNKEHIERHSALREQIAQLKDMNLKVTQEAENLTKALKGDNKAQGNWGEIVLERVLERSGLTKGREYEVQDHHLDSSGKSRKPDVVVQLPENRQVVIDSKVSLVAWERFVNAETHEEAQSQIKIHVQSLRNHVKGLAEKDYQRLHTLNSLDFILLFIPIEAAFAQALQQEENLYNEAYIKNIILVSPTTLLATLRTIANIWKHEYQNRNALEIARQGGDLYDKFVAFTEDMLSLGRQMTATQKSYEEAMKKLTEGRGNLVSRAERLRKLGAGTSKVLDQGLRTEEEAD